MADWFARFYGRSKDGGISHVGDYSLMNTEVEVRNSEVGGFSGEIALGQKKRNQPLIGIARDEFAPYRTLYEIWRQSTGSGICIADGMLSSINLNFNRDTVLVAGKDWKHYLQRRIFPFVPEDYITYNASAPGNFWDTWPKTWPTMAPGDQNPIDIITIVRDLLLSMRTGIATDSRAGVTNPLWPFYPRPSMGDIAPGVPDIVWNLKNTGTTGKYKIYPGDQTSIYDHIQKLSEMKDGFEWDILPLSLEFKVWAPSKFPQQVPVYWFTPSEFEVDGAVTEFDWTNEGPDGTYLLGLGSGRHKMGAIWTNIENVHQFGRLDLVYDYGEVQNYAVILNKLKDQNDLWPQKKLGLTILNPEFHPINFYTGGRPRHLIANTIRVTHDFNPLHKVDAYFQINAIKWNVDASTNESAQLELMQIYEPSDGSSGGIPQEAS